MRGNKRTTRAVPVGTVATLISEAGQWVGRRFFNNGDATVFIGKADVTTANGMPVLQQTAFEDLTSRDAWYGIVAADTEDVRVSEVE